MGERLKIHTNVPVFCNRTHVYRNIGFQTYWSIQDFALVDMNSEFLSDASLYRQVLCIQVFSFQIAVILPPPCSSFV